MSLFVSDPHRGRSKSPGGREPERSRSRDVRAPPSGPIVKLKTSSKKYYDDDDDDDSDSDKRPTRYEYAASRQDSNSTAITRTRSGDYVQTSKPQYEADRRNERHASYSTPDRHEQARPIEYTRHMSFSRNDGYTSPTSDKPNYAPPGQYKWEYDHPEEQDRDHRQPSSPRSEQPRHLSMSTSGSFNVNIGSSHSPQPQYGHSGPPQYPNQPISPISPQYSQQSQYGYISPPATTRPETHRNNSIPLTRHEFNPADHYQYAEPQRVSYTTGRPPDDRRPSYTQTAHAQFVEVKPGGGAIHAPPSPGLGPRMHRLSVSGNAPGALSLAAPGQGHGHIQGGLPPGSPLLEAYRGTYQSISPMPSPMMLPSTEDDDLSDLEQLSPQYSSDDSRRRRTKKSILKKNVSFYDPEPDALALAAVLKKSKPDADHIIFILPHLSDDHIMELRTEYKKHIKVNGKGINIAKHIKLKVPGNLGKVAYAIALGRWESEAHWANFWYQSNTSRRELLIESLMGRTNSDISKIKDAFSDKRYNDSLDKCMQTELKKDKFRTAILLALDEKRMEENTPLSIDMVRRDVQDLYRSLTAKEGGETSMINIIVVRSDNHLREVLKVFETTYRKNFAREMIQKSRNLVVSPLFLFQ